MQIVHVIDTLDPKQGGAVMVSLRAAAAQAALGHEVTLVTSTSEAALGRVAEAFADVPNAGLVRRPVVPFAHASPPALAAVLNRASAVALDPILRGADIVHFHSVWCGITALGATLARRRGVPYVIQPHGHLDPWSLRQRHAKKQLALALGVRRMLDDAGGLLLLNDDERDGIAPLKLRTPIRRVIPNGIYLDEIGPLPPRGTFRARHAAFLGDHPYVLFLSRLHYKKGLDVLADAFARVVAGGVDARLVVVGPEDGAGDGFRRSIADAGLTDRVLIPGPLYGREKYDALVDAAAFCLPSRQEGFSVAILEAMACGTPVVVSDACHFPEVMSAGAGAVVPLDAGAVAAALSAVLGDPTRAAAMGVAGRRLVADRYTWDAVARRSIELYEAVLARRAAER